MSAELSHDERAMSERIRVFEQRERELLQLMRGIIAMCEEAVRMLRDSDDVGGV